MIRSNRSPFSYPVLLVKNANGIWRMCIDYRVLIQDTINDKYLTPIVDELFSSTVFSKLDLRSGYQQIRMENEEIIRQHSEIMEVIMSS